MAVLPHIKQNAHLLHVNRYIGNQLYKIVMEKHPVICCELAIQ